jgi:hypothetical protein
VRDLKAVSKRRQHRRVMARFLICSIRGIPGEKLEIEISYACKAIKHDLHRSPARFEPQLLFFLKRAQFSHAAEGK